MTPQSVKMSSWNLLNIMNNVIIVAEVGVNHNGSIGLAKELIDAASYAGAQIVKFQMFKASALTTLEAPCADYQISSSGSQRSQYEMLKTLELPNKVYAELKDYCTKKQIEFLSTPFDEECASFLVRDIDMKRIKIASGEITNLPFIDYLSRFGKPVILSTGMSTLDEVGAAVKILKQKLNEDQITLLHCTTSYPCDFKDVHLHAMETLRKTFNLPVGYSDHTLGTEVAVAAAALGAVMIEKHITLDRSLPGPDHKASIEPDELKKLIDSVKHVSQALGSREKKPAASELKMREVARKSLVFTQSLPSGTVLKRDHFTAKRPGVGISPSEINKFLGQRLIIDKHPNEFLQWSDIEKRGDK